MIILLVGFRYGNKIFFFQNSDKSGDSFMKNGIMFIYLLRIYKKPIFLNLFKITKIKLHHVHFNHFDMPFKNMSLDYMSNFNEHFLPLKR